jgi:hypothetical protein
MHARGVEALQPGPQRGQLVRAQVGALAQLQARVLPRPAQLDPPDRRAPARVQLAQELGARGVPRPTGVGGGDRRARHPLDRVDRQLAHQRALAPAGACSRPVPAPERERDLARPDPVERRPAKQHR